MGKHLPRRQTVAKLAKNGRHGVKHGDPCAIEPVSQADNAFAPHVICAKRGAVQQSTENIHVGRVEAQRVQQGQAIVYSDRERPRVGIGEEQQVSVRLNRAFRPAGGSRRVVEIYRRVGRHFGQRSNLIEGLQPGDVDHRTARRRNRARTLEQRPLSQHCDGLAVQKDVAQTLLRIAGVDRNIGAAAPARTEDRLDRGDLVLVYHHARRSSDGDQNLQLGRNTLSRLDPF